MARLSVKIEIQPSRKVTTRVVILAWEKKSITHQLRRFGSPPSIALICNIENEGLGEFVQGYGTPLFVSSEYSLKFGSYNYLHFNGKLQLISVVEM